MTEHQEPAIVELGFKSNRRGGWWYREPSNRYTLQIVPSGKERRGWTLGIARPGGIRWGRRSYPSPEAAAFQAFRVVGDTGQADLLATAMQEHQDERMQAIQKRIDQIKKENSDETKNPHLD